MLGPCIGEDGVGGHEEDRVRVRGVALHEPDRQTEDLDRDTETKETQGDKEAT